MDGPIVHVARASCPDPGDGQERGVHARGVRRRARAQRPRAPPAAAAQVAHRYLRHYDTTTHSTIITQVQFKIKAYYAF